MMTKTHGEMTALAYSKGRLYPIKHRVEEIGGMNRMSVMYRITSAGTGTVEGFVRRSFGYRSHSDYGMKTLDRRGAFLGDNLTLGEAVERVLRMD